MKSIEDEILEIASFGVKATEIPTIIADKGRLDEFDPGMVQKLVDIGRLVEIEYILPHMSHRIKSFLLPAGTEVKVVNNPITSIKTCVYATEDLICDHVDVGGQWSCHQQNCPWKERQHNNQWWVGHPGRFDHEL